MDLNKALENINNLGLPHIDAQEDGNNVENQDTYMQYIISKIAEYLETMIPHKVSKLFQILYRIDVNDMKIEAAFDLGKKHLTARKLAELIMERQLEKLETQKDPAKDD